MPDPSPRPGRRPRYRGTHPRRFHERYKELDPARYPQEQAHVREQGRTPAGTHVPILVPEILAALAPAAGEIVVDCTLGYGGHARALAERIGSAGRLIGLDIDGVEMARTRDRLADAGIAIEVARSNFAGLVKVLSGLGLAACDVIFADLGVSSMQLDDPARGFSYKHDGPLDMRMDDRIRRTAADWLNSAAENELAAAFAELADEPLAGPIAADLAKHRRRRPFSRTIELADVVREAVTRVDRSADANRAVVRVFQSLRMLVNDELSALSHLLRVAPNVLRPGGRIGSLCFHSGEDRLVKKAFRTGVEAGIYESASDEPITPSPEERRSNPRSTAAKFRWARRAEMATAG
ncbi:MAG: 16S rRNA (cytosine(1402)-N(4))-methyltransferase RsmH [Planctomycetes bacterium]|nr:16S rRNA (cytosine(1402)-N(4))-methyltransferase RsmH [Planctomycetota bacterium]